MKLSKEVADELFRELLQQGVDAGRVTADENATIYLDTQPIEPTGGAPDGNWLPNGWSADTVDGCRMHRMIELHRASLAQGDEHQRAVAESFPKYFGARDVQAYNLKIDSGEERDRLIAAINKVYWEVLWNSSRDAFTICSFIAGDYQNPEAAVVFDRQKPWDVETAFPPFAVARMDELVEMLRNPDNSEPFPGWYGNS